MERVGRGKTLSRSMRNLPQYFSESSSFFSLERLQVIYLYFEESNIPFGRKREIRSKVLGSMAYPVFVGVIAFGVVLFFYFFYYLKL